jgi:hypothetical protein
MMNRVLAKGLALVAAVAIVGVPSLARGAPLCPARLAQEAEMEVLRIRNWESLYKAFRRYQACDDGAIGQGFSDRVAHLLASQWNSTSTLQLQQLINRDGEFLPFLVRHVDETADPQDLLSIVRHARERGCLSLTVQVCEVLQSRALAAAEALRKIPSTSK